MWKAEYFAFVPASFRDIWIQALTFHHYNEDENEYLKWHSTAPANVAIDYQIVTGEQLTPGHKHHIHRLPQFYLKKKKEKFGVLAGIAAVYKKIVSPLFALALISHFVLLGKALWGRRSGFEAISGLIVLAGIVAMISLLTYVKSATLTWAINRPLYAVYPLILLYICLMIGYIGRNLSRGNQQCDWHH